MQINWKWAGILAGIALLIGVLIGTQFSCANNSTDSTTLDPHRATTPVHSPDSLPNPTPDTVLHLGTAVIDTVSHISFRVDTFYIAAPFWIHDTIPCSTTKAGSQSVAPPKPFSIPDLLLRAAPSVIAAAEPRNPIQFFEAYGHLSHNFIGGGYAAGGEFDVNLETIRLAPVTLFADLGYDQGIHLNVGLRMKVWGAP